MSKSVAALSRKMRYIMDYLDFRGSPEYSRKQ